ncbi:MAG: outer membrane protein TolC [Verrucomicrobiales bacterium]|jgi:outer membrane protein TolC
MIRSILSRFSFWFAIAGIVAAIDEQLASQIKEGRLQNSHRKADELALSAEADDSVGQLLVASGVAAAYFEWLSLIQEKALFKKTVTDREDSLALLEKRFGAGLDDKESAS